MSSERRRKTGECARHRDRNESVREDRRSFVVLAVVVVGLTYSERDGKSVSGLRRGGKEKEGSQGDGRH